MKLEQLKALTAMVAIDFAKLEEAYVAMLLKGAAVGVSYTDGKPEIRVIDYDQLYGNRPDMMIVDDIGTDELLRCYAEPVLEWTESEKQVKAREQANRRTKEAKKPLPYYHGHKRRF